MPALPGPNYKGWRLTDAADALEALWAGVSKFSLGSGGVTIPVGQTLTVAGYFGMGAPEAVTIVSGVATVTRGYVILDAEGAGTTDTLDSLTATGAVAGDIIRFISTATDTITFDNSATMLLGASTRALAPGGYIDLQLLGTTWTERGFLTATS